MQPRECAAAGVEDLSLKHSMFPLFDPKHHSTASDRLPGPGTSAIWREEGPSSAEKVSSVPSENRVHEISAISRQKESGSVQEAFRETKDSSKSHLIHTWDLPVLLEEAPQVYSQPSQEFLQPLIRSGRQGECPGQSCSPSSAVLLHSCLEKELHDPASRRADAQRSHVLFVCIVPFTT